MRILLRNIALAAAVVLALGVTMECFADVDKLDRCSQQYADCLNDPSGQVDCDAQFDRCLEAGLSALFPSTPTGVATQSPSR